MSSASQTFDERLSLLRSRVSALGERASAADKAALLQELKTWDSELLLSLFLRYERDSSDAALKVPGGVCKLDNQLISLCIKNLQSGRRSHLDVDLLAKCSEGRVSLLTNAVRYPPTTSLPGPEVVSSEQAWLDFLGQVEAGHFTNAQNSDLGMRLLRCLGAQYASMLADCFGHASEFEPWNKSQPAMSGMPSEPIGQFQLKRGQYTDDSSMGLCLMDNLLASLTRQRNSWRSRSDNQQSSHASSEFEFDAIDCALRFQCWNLFGYNCAFGFEPDRANTFFGHAGSVGLGGNISQSMGQFWSDGHAFTTAGHKDTSGNGSVMRMAPLHLAFHAHPTIGMRIAAEQSLVTHQGTEAAECCRLLAFLCAKIISRPKDSDAHISLRQLLDACVDEFSKEHCQPHTSVWYLARSEMQDNDVNRNWNWRNPNFDYAPARVSSQPGYVGSYVMDAMSMALHIAYHHSPSLSAAILWNSSKGGDADSVGAVLGQIVGAFYGIRDLPFEWIKTIFRWDGEPCGTVLRRSIKLFELANSQSI